jgi:hypothetical protein
MSRRATRDDPLVCQSSDLDAPLERRPLPLLRKSPLPRAATVPGLPEERCGPQSPTLSADQGTGRVPEVWEEAEEGDADVWAVCGGVECSTEEREREGHGVMVMHFHRRGRLNGSTLNVVGTTRSTDDKAEDDEKRAARAAKKREKYANLTPEERREVARQANAARNKRMGWGR